MASRPKKLGPGRMPPLPRRDIIEVQHPFMRDKPIFRYRNPWFRTYTFPIIAEREDGQMLACWVKGVAQNWDRVNQMFTSVKCPYLEVARKYGVPCRVPTAAEENRIIDRFMFEHMDDAIVRAKWIDDNFDHATWAKRNSKPEGGNHG